MAVSLVPERNAALVLADGTVFSGYGIGEEGASAGEICFTTGMTGYQETLTDPSFAGQIITFTFPHVGNVGANEEDIECELPRASGLVLREAITEPSNFRATMHLDAWLKSKSLRGITGVDTRRLTCHIRDKGAQNAAIVFGLTSHEARVKRAKEFIALAPDMAGLELAASVSSRASVNWTQSRWKLGRGYGVGAGEHHVVAIDFGNKCNIPRSLTEYGCKVTMVHAETSAADIMALKPDGIFLSNGPGDPSATGLYAIATLRALIDAGLPIFGICLGHQLLALALGAKTEKMRQGHRGANHPVKNLLTGKVEITSQNHGFCVSDNGLPEDVEVTHRSLFDGTIEGLRHRTKPVFSVQYHPESSPGPHDSLYLFTQFTEMMA